MSARASFSIAPHSGVGGNAPKPRKHRLAAEMIDVPIRIEPYSTIGEIVPGRMWRMMMVQSDAPPLLTAST
ncbi:hypothetical protein G6F60_015482 [Rhizopus arrhizus]|nr:hypothetical protein G6F60_015482 [Rhizopus arrhizus]